MRRGGLATRWPTRVSDLYVIRNSSGHIIGAITAQPDTGGDRAMKQMVRADPSLSVELRENHNIIIKADEDLNLEERVRLGRA